MVSMKTTLRPLKAKIQIIRFLIIATLGGGLSSSIFAADMAPLSWNGSPETDSLFQESLARAVFDRQAHTPNEISPKERERILSDFDQRIPKGFQIPSSERNTVEFWFRVYTEWTSDQVTFYDRHHPNIVYEVMDFSSLARTSRNRVVYEILRKRQIDRRIAEYRKSFELLQAKRKNTAHPEIEEKILAAQKLRGRHSHSWSEWSQNLRTQTGQRDRAIAGYKRALPYWVHMEGIFESYGIPHELLNIALVESSFNYQAISKVGAVGAWQFMPATGKEFLTIDDDNIVDERLSPLKATVAAARLLHRNHRVLQDWSQATVAYHSGFRPFYRIARNSRLNKPVSELYRHCGNQSAIGWAGRNYYPEVLAMLFSIRYRDLVYPKFNESPEVTPIQYVYSAQSENALSFALRLGIPLHQFKQMNPDILDFNANLPKGFMIAIPGNKDRVSLLLRGGKKEVPSV
jgi:membrane-bound lytic murein transglycosylase D